MLTTFRRSAAPLYLLALSVSVFMTTAACKAKPRAPQYKPPVYTAPILGQVVVESFADAETAAPPAQFDDAALTAKAKAQLEGARIFVEVEPRGQDTPRANVRIRYRAENVWHDGKGLARAMVKLRIDVKPARAADPYWVEDVEATGEIPYESESESKAPPRAFTTLVSRMIEDTLRDYIDRQSLRTMSDASLVKVIQHGPPAQIEDAMRISAQRSLKAAVGPLLVRLNDEDENLRDAALGALVTLREPRAVSVLAESRSMRDTREMRKILTAIGLLGGQEALEYLRFVVEAHEDEEIKDMAKEALEKLEKRP